MKRICLISYTPPYTIPYIDIYLKIFKENQVQCDVLFWDRDGTVEYQDEEYVQYYPYKGIARTSQSKIKRYYHYLPSTIFFYKKLIKGNYDGIVFLQTHAAVACKFIIENKYKNKYIVDIRDFTLENIKIYRNIEKQVIENSYQTIISSPGYKNFLPIYDYVIAHNYTKQLPDVVNVHENKKTNKKIINISFIGSVRFYEIAKKMLLLFKDDNRFHLSFIGTGADALKGFCNSNNINNVTLIDTFMPEETRDYYRNCDIVNNVYGNRSNYLDFALSNKLYYAAQFGLPILVSKNTFSAEISKKYNFGIEFDPDDEQQVDKLYEKIKKIDYKKMNKGINEFLKQVENENSAFHQTIKKFISSI